MKRSHLTLAAAILLAAPLARPAEAQLFADVSQDVGLDHLHQGAINTGGMSGGMAWFDLDGDGADDLFAGSSDGNHRLFRNDRGDFLDATAGSGVALPGTENMGAIAADVNQDGRCDLYLTNLGPNSLLLNGGKGSFREVGKRTGAAGYSWSSSASFADFDLDGDLDLYVGNYITVGMFPWHLGAPNDLFINRSEEGETRFDEVARRLGVDCRGTFGDPPNSPYLPFLPPIPTGTETAACTLSVCTLDYDEDGDADLFVGNDFGEWVMPDLLFRNEVSGGVLRFEDVTAETNFDQRPLYNMGINPCDFDRDGDWDLYLSNLGDNVLLRNDGGTFTDVTYDLGPVSGKDAAGKELVSWGTVWGDFDNDGWEDLFVANGYVPAAYFLDNDELQANHLWMNDQGCFRGVSGQASGLADEHGIARGVGGCDFDGDGRLDVFVQNTGDLVPSQPGYGRLFRNAGMLGSGNHWIQLRLRGTKSNNEGIGARVELQVNQTSWKRQVLGDPVYLSSASRVLHFGLGAAEQIDRVVIHWPSGIVQFVEGLEVDRRHEIVETPPELDPTPGVSLPGSSAGGR